MSSNIEKRKYGKWSAEDMERALHEYSEDKLGLNACCRKYLIPKPTFLRHFQDLAKRGTDRFNGKRAKIGVNGRLPALPVNVEQELAEHMLYLDKHFFGLTITDVRTLAFDILDKNPKLANPFNKEKRIAGKKWYYGFMARHPNLRLRQPECISISRAKGFNKENVYEFFDLLESIVDENKFDATSIFNMDESGFSTVQKKSSKVHSEKGKRQVGTISSGERGINTTFVCCCNAAGVIPVCHKSGWIQTHLFTRWFTEFIAKVKPTKDDPVILILDGHYSHTRNIDLIELARSNFVSIICLPPHCTDRLQPLDVSFMMPFKSYYGSEIEMRLNSHPNRVLTHVQIGKLMANAFIKSSTMTVAMNGFAKTGIIPFNRNVFTDADFIAITVSDSTLQNEKLCNENPVVDELLQEELEVEALQFTPQSASSKSTSITPEDIRPVPVITVSWTENNKRAGKTCVLTASPYKAALKESLEKVAAKEQKKKVNQQKKSKSASTVDDPVPGTSKSKPTKKASKIATNLPSTSKPKKAQKKVVKQTARRRFSMKDNSESSEDSTDESITYASSTESEEDVECPFCHKTYFDDKHGEEWVQCTLCFIWAHAECDAAIDENSKYKCSFCLNI